MSSETKADLAYVLDLAKAVAALGEAVGLPFVAVSHDIAGARPILGPDGRPLAETVFRWVDPSLKYWADRAFALRASFIHAARCCAEPFWYADGRFGSWRPMPVLEAIDAGPVSEVFGVTGAIMAPAYLPGGVIGAVCWATNDPAVDVRAVFNARAPELHAAALRLIGAYGDAVAAGRPAPRLTRREIQCLKWAAAGKTDSVVAQIMHISLPTVRFHIRNAAEKMQVMGRAQATHRAAVLGYVSGGGA
jgi:DNA-binding CsgD family transcriptional regulator